MSLSSLPIVLRVLFILCSSLIVMTKRIDLKRIKAVSFDVTGTLLIHKDPIMETYSKAAEWAMVPNPPTPAELKAPFKQAYKEMLIAHPAFRNHKDFHSSRRWWAETVKRTLALSGRNYTEAEFHRFFRRVYQHFGKNYLFCLLNSITRELISNYLVRIAIRI